MGITRIRPRVLFERIEALCPDANVPLNLMMPPSGIGSLRLLESAVLVALLRLRGASSIFEFGTFLGATTVVFAMNSAEDAIVTTLDISPEELAEIDGLQPGMCPGSENDRLLRGISANRRATYIARSEQAVQAKIRQVLQNSRSLDVDQMNYRSKFDMIFIDGAHDYDTVKSDTEKALIMSKPDPVVAWHDFGSPLHPDVTRLVTEFSTSNPVIHVEDTMVAFHWKKFYGTLA